MALSLVQPSMQVCIASRPAYVGHVCNFRPKASSLLASLPVLSSDMTFVMVRSEVFKTRRSTIAAIKSDKIWEKEHSVITDASMTSIAHSFKQFFNIEVDYSDLADNAAMWFCWCDIHHSCDWMLVEPSRTYRYLNFVRSPDQIVRLLMKCARLSASF